jgi:hypothetical protein
MTPMEPSARLALFEERYLALLRGEVDGIAPMVAALAGDHATRSQAFGLSAAWWHAEPSSGRIAAPEALRALETADGAAAIAAYHGLRAALVTRDLELLVGFRDFLVERAPDRIEAAAATLFAGVAEGRTDAEAARELAARASRERRPLFVIDATVLQALGELASGAGDVALAHARRASRMAQSEGMPQAEYLANLVLARARRLNGLPHLATRILAGLAKVVPSPWRGWLAIELALAGAVELAGEVLDGAGDEPSVDTARLLLSAIDGLASEDVQRYRAAIASLAGSRWSDIAADASTMTFTIDPHASLADAPVEVIAWCAGASDLPPRGLWGLSARSRDDSEEAAVACVLAGPSDTARRFLVMGAPLATNAGVLKQTRRKQGRLDTTIAVLALAGPDGLADDELFRRVYLFAYAPHLHRSALDVLLHRVRERLGDTGTLSRTDGRVALAFAAPVVITDPRCGRPIDDRLLYLLATRGHATAKEAAQALAVPLRTAQAALQDLVEDGSCQRLRHGNRVEYRIEDTTFSEPTRH